jgi:hypothetical protein
VPKLQKDVMRVLQAGQFILTGLPEGSVTKVYENTTKGSPLRQFLVNNWIKTWANREAKAETLYQREYPTEFYTEALETLRLHIPTQFTNALRVDGLESIKSRRDFSGDWRKYTF